MKTAARDPGGPRIPGARGPSGEAARIPGDPRIPEGQVDPGRRVDPGGPRGAASRAVTGARGLREGAGPVAPRREEIEDTMKREPADLLLRGASELLTLAGPPGPRAGAAQDRLGIVPGGALAIRDGRIVAVGSERELERFDAAEILDAGGCVVMPGFVDPHTHPVFAGTREDEFHQRIAGADYAAIARAGGGILSSVRSFREASDETLRDRFLRRLDGFLETGTTTIEGKSGYALETEGELRALRILRDVPADHPVDVVPTFLGAHEVPAEHRANPARYVSIVCDTMIPRVAEEGLAEFCDVFCEAHVFDVPTSRRILEAARERGMRPKIHADEIEPLGGAELAAELGAASADHLVAVSEAGIEAMARAGVVAVLLPGTTFHLAKDRFAPARRMIEAGVPVALATDLNPGTSPNSSMPLVVALACVRLRMRPAEALVAATINAAHAIGRGEEMGSLEVGKLADVLILDVPNHKHFGYAYGANPVSVVVKRGRVVYRRQSGLVDASPRGGGGGGGQG